MKFEADLYTKVNTRSEEHTSELQSLTNLVCRLLLEKKKKTIIIIIILLIYYRVQTNSDYTFYHYY